MSVDSAGNLVKNGIRLTGLKNERYANEIVALLNDKARFAPARIGTCAVSGVFYLRFQF